MATNRWTPNAAPVAQVSTATITGYDVTTTYIVAMNGKTISVLGQGGTAATTAAALQAALAAAPQSLYPEFYEVTWSVNAAVITGTAKKPGYPFTFTTSVSGGAGTFGAFTAVTANTGPFCWGTAANWSLGAVPVSTNDVYIDLNNGPIMFDLAQSAVTLNSLNVAASYTGSIGLTETNNNGSFAYHEYRPRYLAIGVNPGLANIGYGAGQGATLLYIDFGSVQVNAVVAKTGNSQASGLETAQLKGTNASNVLTVVQGAVAFCGNGGDVGALATLNVGYVSSPATDSAVRTGPGATVTTLNQDGGLVDMYVGPTTTTMEGGTLYVRTGGMTTATIDAGTLFYCGQGTITTANVGNNGTLDFTQSPSARTVTTLNLFSGAVYNDPFATVTITNPIFMDRCKLVGQGAAYVDVGINRHLAVT